MASIESTPLATHCSRSSGVVSTSTRVEPYEITTDGRVRLSRASVLEQTSQWHPIIGMPALVPVPRKSSSMEDIGMRCSGMQPDCKYLKYEVSIYRAPRSNHRLGVVVCRRHCSRLEIARFDKLDPATAE